MECYALDEIAGCAEGVIMIIFDLDTLADCEHRRHFVQDPFDTCINCYEAVKIGGVGEEYQCPVCKRYSARWKPDCKAFHEACDKDIIIQPSLTVIRGLLGWDYYDNDEEVHIWSGRCESVRNKTEKWLEKHSIAYKSLKMRPIGDNIPDDVLMEKWLDKYIESMWPKLPAPSEENKGNVFYRKPNIDFVFASRPEVICMWRRRGIFVFNCAQSDE